MQLTRRNVREYIKHQSLALGDEVDYDPARGRWFWALETMPSPLEAFAGDVSQACLRIAHERAAMRIEEMYPLTLALVRRINAAGRFPSVHEKALIRDMDAMRQRIERDEYERAKKAACGASQRHFKAQVRAS